MNQDLAEHPHTRREFLLRSAKAGALIAASSLAGFLLHDSKGPAASSDGDSGSVSLPDFSIPGLTSRMCIATGDDRTRTANLALKSLGGMETFVQRGDHVLIKVNAAFATPAILCATTHPDLVSEVVRLCIHAGAASVTVTDNPINDPESCFALTGIGEAARSSGARLALPRQTDFHPTTVSGGMLIRKWPLLYEPFKGVNKVIGMAPVKDHHRSGASMSLKNWYGLLGGRRNIFHQDIHRLIQELALMIKPTLVILDGTFTMMTNGPTGGSLGDLKQTNTLIVSTDQVAADAFGATLLGRSARDLPFIGKAAESGAGTQNFESLQPIRVTA